ncbi:MAG: hypothetical protein PUE84_10265 [Firmicutes bacterium]|nr:hypothetical protein [Bacillota bacterium]
MKKVLKWAGIAFAAAAACWFTLIVWNSSDFEIWFAAAAIVSSILFVCLLAVCGVSWLAARKGKNVSPYKIFAAADLLVGLLVAAYAVHDILTSVGFFGGLLGVLLLLFVMPVVAAFLVIDFILAVRKKRRIGNERAACEGGGRTEEHPCTPD